MTLKTISFLILSLLWVASSFGQVYTFDYMYMGHDTLDYSDGCTSGINFKITGISADTILNKTTITGRIFGGTEKYPIDSAYGRIFLGDIGKIVGNTWLGKTNTGLLRISERSSPDNEGYFKISVPSDTKKKIIFTGIGFYLITCSLDELYELFIRKEPYYKK